MELYPSHCNCLPSKKGMYSFGIASWAELWLPTLSLAPATRPIRGNSFSFKTKRALYLRGNVLIPLFLFPRSISWLLRVASRNCFPPYPPDCFLRAIASLRQLVPFTCPEYLYGGRKKETAGCTYTTMYKDTTMYWL